MIWGKELYWIFTVHPNDMVQACCFPGAKSLPNFKYIIY
jgi:hypothetical protein